MKRNALISAVLFGTFMFGCNPSTLVNDFAQGVSEGLAGSTSNLIGQFTDGGSPSGSSYSGGDDWSDDDFADWGESYGNDLDGWF